MASRPRPGCTSTRARPTSQLHEAAILIGLLRSPETGDPTSDPETATARRDEVLGDMVDTGVLTRPEADAARQLPLRRDRPLQPGDAQRRRRPALHRMGARSRRSSNSARPGCTAGASGSTPRSTSTTRRLLKLPWRRCSLIRPTRRPPSWPLDADGAIRAHVGGRDFEALQVDLARGQDGGGTGRQPGSTLQAVRAGRRARGRDPARHAIPRASVASPWTPSRGRGRSRTTAARATARCPCWKPPPTR